MTEKKPIFRRVLDAVIEGRARQAQRFVDDYLASRDRSKGAARFG